MYDASNDTYDQLDITHAKVHRGASFVYAREYTIAVSGSSAILIVPAVGEELHFTAGVSTKGTSVSRLYRNPVITSNGSEVAWLNRNDEFQGTKTLTSKIYLNPSYSLATDPNKGLMEVNVNAAGIKADVGAIANDRLEIPMQSTNKYVLEVTDSSAATNNSAVNISVYRDGQPY